MKAEKNFNKCSFNKKWALLGGFIVLFFLIGAENANALPSCVDYKNSSWCGDSYCDPGLYCTGDNIMCDDYYGCVCNVECVNNCCLGNYCRPQCSTKKDTSWCGDGYCDPGTYCCGNNTMCSDGKNCDCDKECINNSCLDGVCRKCYYKDTDGLTYNETCVSKAGTFKDYCDGNTKVTYWCTASETCGKHTTACAAGETCQVQSNGEPKCIVACKSQGTACSATSECCTGLTCKDGYCCNQACTGTCTHCNATPGTCTYITAGTDPDEECTGTGTCGGTCNGSGACQYPSTSVTCSSLQDCDYLNYYYQSGTESPTATEYCYYRDYDDRYQYCDGAGSCASLNCNVYSDSLQYSCGTCKYISASNCTGGTLGSCTNYPDGTSCDTTKSCTGGVCKDNTKIDCYFGATTCIFDKSTIVLGESVWVCGILRTAGGTAISGQTISFYVRNDGGYDKVFDVGTTDANGYACKSWTPPNDPKYTGTKKYILFFAGNTYNQSQTAEYSLTVECGQSCKSVGGEFTAVVNGADYCCATCSDLCGWRSHEYLIPACAYHSDKICLLGTDCFFSDPYVDSTSNSCSTSATICRLDYCPDYAGGEGMKCTTRRHCTPWTGGYNVKSNGYWDPDDKRCVQCDTYHKEIKYCASATSFDTNCDSSQKDNAPCTGTGDGLCEAACGAHPDCDEKYGDDTNGDPCGTGKTCNSSCQCITTQCYIGGTYYDNGQCNPTNKCQYCDKSNPSSWSNVPSGKVCTASGVVPVSATNYCNYDEDCDAGDCYATKWYTSCNGLAPSS